jgi:hypothetical protein
MQQPAQPFGERVLAYRFVNTTRTTLAAVRTEIVLPPSFVVSAVDDSEPSAGPASAAPPYAVRARGDRRAVTIARDDVELGDIASVTFRFKERRVPGVVPMTLLMIGLTYLVVFRHRRSPGERT